MTPDRHKKQPPISHVEISLDDSIDLVLILSDRGDFLYGNAAAKKLFHFIDKPIQNLLPLESIAGVQKSLRDAIRGDEAKLTFAFQTPLGRIIYLEGFFSGSFWKGKQAVLAILRPLDARQDELRTLAEKHALTEGLLETARVVNSTLDLDEVLDRIMEIVGRVVPHDASSLMILEDGIARVVRHRGYRERGLEKAVEAVRFPVATTPNFQAMMDSHEPQVIGDILNYSGWVSHPALNWSRSYASAPVIVRGEIIGFLNLDSATPYFYNIAHAEHLRLFADQAALAIQNARLYSEIQKNAITDYLTGVLNRRGLFETGEQEVQRAKRFRHKLGILLFDIDHFKLVNDTYGHHIGDVVLAEVGKRCRDGLRQLDLIGRYGGEEFAILLPECTLSFANEVAERIQKAVAQVPFETEAGTLSLTISIGVTHLLAGDKNFSELIRRADSAMYAAKKAGRDRIKVIPSKG